MLVIGDLSRLNAIRYPDKVALVLDEATLTYRELNLQSNRLAHGLLERGVVPGDRIALLAYNRLDYAVVTQAVAKCGAMLVPLNFRFVASEIRHVLADAEPKVLFLEASFAAAVSAACVDLPHPPTLVFMDDAGAPEGALTLPGLSAEREAGDPPVTVDPQSSCVIMYTSGTTGFPKGVLVSHATYFKMYLATAVEASLRHEEVFLLAVPMFHAAGLNMALHQSLFLGATGIIHRGGFDPVVIMRLIEKHRVTFAILVPMTVNLLAHHPEVAKFDLSSLDKIFYGSAPITRDVLEQAFRVFPSVKFTQLYGSTEAGMVSALRYEDHPDWAHVTGRQALLTESRIVDDTGRVVGLGEVGEIIVRQETMGMIDYWRNPEASAATIRNGWIHTGDLARVERNGYFTVIDRLKEIIISGGENIYPKEVENVIAAHPAVREVAVFGLPDPLYGETVCAALACWPGKSTSAEEITQLCREQLAAYKRPRRIEFVEALPRNASDKIQKNLLRQRFRAQAGAP
ncbi:MAG: AMP-binding protein [Gammaproteobacteria bacterium]|nr:AMP-binding protein [Gammaproteobacteria bacterium]